MIGLGAALSTGCAHSSQNRAPGRSAVPQLAQLGASGAAHASQNLADSRFSCPQPGQFTEPTLPRGRGALRIVLLAMRGLGTRVVSAAAGADLQRDRLRSRGRGPLGRPDLGLEQGRNTGSGSECQRRPDEGGQAHHHRDRDRPLRGPALGQYPRPGPVVGVAGCVASLPRNLLRAGLVAGTNTRISC